MAAIDGDAKKERHGFAYGQDERHREGRHAPRKPVDANDAQELCQRVRQEVPQRRGQCERRGGAVERLGQERVYERERGGCEGDGRAGARSGELGGDALAREVKEGEGERVDVKHVFLPGWLCEGVGRL